MGGNEPDKYEDGRLSKEFLLAIIPTLFLLLENVVKAHLLRARDRIREIKSVKVICYSGFNNLTVKFI